MKSSSEKNKSRKRRKIGDIVKVPLGDGTFGFGQVLKEPLVAFFNLRSDGRSLAEEVVETEILFAIWVMNSAVERDWPVIGHCKVSPDIDQEPAFFKKDQLTGDYSITYDGSDERQANRQDIEGLERAAVWEPNHVADRLLDYFEGRPNRWVVSLRP